MNTIYVNPITLEELSRSQNDKISTLAMLAMNHRNGQMGGSPDAEQELADILVQ